MALVVLILPVLFRDAVTSRVDLASYSRRHLLIFQWRGYFQLLTGRSVHRADVATGINFGAQPR